MIIDLFRLVSRLLIGVCGCVNGNVKEELQIADAELDACAVLHLMKMLHSMAVNEPDEMLNENSKLRTREINLTTIESLYEN